MTSEVLEKPRTYRYALWLLLGIYSVNFVDRQVINILAEPIKREFHLADWQLGALTGFSFGLFYTVLGFPIAAWADRGNRPLIIGVSTAIWSVCTVACGLTQNFIQLALGRVGVGIGEAGCTPAALSLIADFTPRERRGSAMAFYQLGSPLGILLGLVMGGLFADAYGWRVAFMIAGAPGLLFALLSVTTLNEPRRRLKAAGERLMAKRSTFRETMKLLSTKKTFWLVCFATTVQGFTGYAQGPFVASFFMRAHGPEVARLASSIGLKPLGFLGIAIGVALGMGGLLGVYLGGYAADRIGRRDLRGYCSVPAFSSIIVIPIFITVLLVPSVPVAMACLVLRGVLGTMWQGPMYAVCNGVVPPHMRATATAMQLLIANLLGLALGPLIVGALSDTFAGRMHMGSAEGLRWALIISTLAGYPAFTLFWKARDTVRADMES
jgi:MFS family permease